MTDSDAIGIAAAAIASDVGGPATAAALEHANRFAVEGGTRCTVYKGSSPLLRHQVADEPSDSLIQGDRGWTRVMTATAGLVAEVGYPLALVEFFRVR